MADLTITASDVRAVKIFEQMPSAPTDEVVAAGQAVRLNTTTGLLTKSNASSAAEARTLGIAINGSTAANIAAIDVIRKGILNVGSALSALAYDAPVYLSDTDGSLADAAGTTSVVVGRVVPGMGSTTPEKLLFVDL